MPINNFKPFAFAVGARVLSQVSWDSDTGVINGFTAGIVTKERMNKALRQPSAIAAALAEVVGNRIGEDMLDNGDMPRLVRQIDAAFGSAGGGGGGVGGAQLFQMKTTGIAFVFESSTSSVSSSPTITFSVEMIGFTATVAYTAQAFTAAGTPLGSVALGGVLPTATMTASQFLTYPTTQYVVVTAAVTLTTGTILTDTETIYKSVNGDGALQTRLTNVSATLPALADGTVTSYATAVGTLQAYQGQTLLSNVTNPSVSFSLVGYAGFSTVYPAAQAGISVNATTGAYAVTGGMTSDAALVQIRCTFSNGAPPQDAFFSLAKSRQGLAGPNGTAPQVELEAQNQIFVTPSNSTTPAPSSVNITALVYNIPSPTYVWRIDGVVQGTTSPVLTLPSFPAGGAPKVVRCDVTGTGPVTAFDSASFFSIKDGDDAIRAGIENETRTIACLADGTPTAGLPITAQIVTVRGATVITNLDGVTYQLVSSTGFTGLSLSATGLVTITGITADIAEAIYTITLNGNVIPAGRLIAVKSRDGTIGADAIVDRLTNGNVSVPADSAGTITSYAAAAGVFQVSKGALTLTNVTSPSVVFSMVGYTGFSTVYPAAQVGIGINAVTGEYAVTNNMAQDSATVTFRATVSGGVVRDQVFTLTKQKEGAGTFSLVLEPRTEILLPSNSTGQVISYENANTTIKVRGSTDDTVNWTAALTNTGVVANLSGPASAPVVTVTQLIPLGEIGSSTFYAIDYVGAGWDRVNQIIQGPPGVWIATGFGISSGPVTKVKRSTDYENWTDITVPSGRWYVGVYQAGVFVLAETNTGATNRILRSTDGGLTWSTSVTLSATSQWQFISASSTRILVSSQIAGILCSSSDGGATWTTISSVPSGMAMTPIGGTSWMSRDNSDVTRRSTNDGASWTVVSGLPGVMNAAVLFKGRVIVTLRYTATNTISVSSDGGVTFSSVTLPSVYTNGFPLVIGDAVFMATNTRVVNSADGLQWGQSSTNGPAHPLLGSIVSGGSTNALGYTTSQSFKLPLIGTSPDTGSVLITMSKAGQPNLTRVLPVRKTASATNDLYIATAFPSPLSFPSTFDGVVTSYAINSITGTILRNGIDDTANWTVTWNTLSAGLTPASGSGNVATFTNMANNVDSVVVRFSAIKVGQPTVTGDILVLKNKGSDSSGPQRSVYSAFTANATSITLRFTPDGYFQIKQGAGAFVNGGVWHNPPSTNVGAGFWIRVDATGHAITGAATGTWLQLNANRDYILTDTNPGTHTTLLDVYIGTSNTGTNATPATGSLKIIV